MNTIILNSLWVFAEKLNKKAKALVFLIISALCNAIIQYTISLLRFPLEVKLVQRSTSSHLRNAPANRMDLMQTYSGNKYTIVTCSRKYLPLMTQLQNRERKYL